jgi:hypothetical protein
MGYFDGLAASSFKTDDKGNTVFFPWGILGKGYILPEDKKVSIRCSFKHHMVLILTLAINTATLYFLEVVSLLFVVAGIYVLIIMPQKWIIGISSILVFGFGVLVFWRMIKTKHEDT